MDWLARIFEANFFPHGHCYFWEPGTLILTVASDFGIFFAYFTIPLALRWFVRNREDLPFSSIFVLFAAFILSCGTNHLISIVTVWHPIYRFEALMKAVTAIISLATAVTVYRALPLALKIPSPAQLREALDEANAEAERRASAEAALLDLNRELEQHVADRTAALRQSLRDMQEFARALSHDLKEPLRMVSGYTYLLEEDLGASLDAEHAEQLRYARDGAERMASMVDDLRDFARAGTTARPTESFSLADAADVVLAQLEEVHAGVRAWVEIDAQLEVDANRVDVMRVLQNLLSNAIKYSEAPPEISIAATRNADGGCSVSVRDRGIGIASEHQGAIFELFRRLHAHDEIPGSGVGLAVCRRLVERWGGEIEVTSEVGEGSTFTFTIPRDPHRVSAPPGELL